MTAPLYCAFFSSPCFSVADWKDIALTIATYVAIPGAIFAAWKTFQEINKSLEQRATELQLKRVDFTLTQHRRLFDDPVLYSVLCLIDSDHPQLRDESMWDAKRKFLTFFEEIALLVNSKYIDSDVAFYMFGYYAKCAYEGINFKEGICLKPEYWGLFFDFVKKADNYLKSAASSTHEHLKL